LQIRDQPIEIDGSYGEGGGQIVRTAVALSAVTGKPVKIKKIRQGRRKPGLAPQHAQAISALARLCSARITGVEPGSSEVSFDPGEIQGGSYRIDIGTAGSITLLMQCLMPATLKADGPVSLEIQGGTDVQWSPTVDYFKNVFLPALTRFRAEVSLEIRQRGYYPKGQGSVVLSVEPGDLQSALLIRSETHRVDGVSHSSNLPEHVARRQAESALQALKDAGYDAEVSSEILALPSTGSGITLWSGFKGASALGKRGLPAEKVGRTAAEEMISEMASSTSVDVHLADQLIPYIALAGGSYTTREISMHARTNIWTARHFLDREIKVSEEREKIFRIDAA
jgi:RNA 3'-terminal phosphate cyclase (ATP)